MGFFDWFRNKFRRRSTSMVLMKEMYAQKQRKSTLSARITLAKNIKERAETMKQKLERLEGEMLKTITELNYGTRKIRLAQSIDDFLKFLDSIYNQSKSNFPFLIKDSLFGKAILFTEVQLNVQKENFKAYKQIIQTAGNPQTTIRGGKIVVEKMIKRLNYIISQTKAVIDNEAILIKMAS